MSRTLKVTGNRVMYDRGAWFLSVIMSSSRTLCCLLKIYYQFHLLSWPIFFPLVYNKTIIWFGFCDSLYNQGLSKGTSTFIFPDIKETFSDNCLIWGWTQPIAPRDRWRIIYLFSYQSSCGSKLNNQTSPRFYKFCYHSHAIHHGLGCEWRY